MYKKRELDTTLTLKVFIEVTRQYIIYNILYTHAHLYIKKNRIFVPYL